MPRKIAVTPDMKALMIANHDGIKQTIELARAAVLLHDAATAALNSQDDLTDEMYSELGGLSDQVHYFLDLLLKRYAEDCGIDLIDTTP